MALLEFTASQFQYHKQWTSTFILNLSFLSQVLLIFVQWVFSNLIPDHIPDGVFHKVQIPESESPTDLVIKSIFGSFERWDALYFLHIAQFGYTYENTVAFFPLFPILIHGVSFIINSATLSSLNASSCFILSAILINVLCFSLSSVVLHRIALKVSNQNIKFSCVVVLLFLVNPSRVFFVAPYSESLFSLTTFLGILSLYETWNFKSCIFFALSVSTRSNGILNVGFIIHKYLNHIFESCLRKTNKKRLPYFLLVWNIICLSSALGFVLAPFIYYQMTTRSLFCDPNNLNLSRPQYVISYAQKHNLVLPGKSQASYCKSFEFPYSYVQKHYWNVGFLRYFQLKQIPNFLLAAPILLLIFFASYEYFIICKKIQLLFNLKVIKSNHYSRKHFNGNFLMSYYLHIFFLALFCFLCIHVQVSTRMLLSSSPLVYFIVANYVMENHHLAKYCLFYFCTYCLVGLLLFTNYYPWT